jgi:hypothetical protein
MTARTGKTATGSREYRLIGNYYACRMGNGLWYIFEKEDGPLDRDTGIDYPTLRDCRRWAQHNISR